MIDLAALIQQGRVYIRPHFDTHQVFDASTNEVLLVYRRTGDGSILPFDKIVDAATGTITWQDPTRAPAPVLIEASHTPYSEEVVHRIAERMIEGESLTHICRDKEMPTYAQLSRWMRVHPWIKQTLEDARELRAEHYRDRVLAEAASATSTKDPIEASKVVIEANKWAAAMDNARYKQNNKVDIGISMPTQIIVQTGVDRTPVSAPSTVDSVPQIEEKTSE